MSCEVRFLYLIKEDKKMKNKVLKKTLAAALALTLVSGAMPTVIGRNGLTKPAIVADAAGIGDIINFGDNIGNYPGYYASADGRTEHIIADELELKIYRYCDDYTKVGVAYPQVSYESENTDILVDVPAGREVDVPTGVKIISGTGEENDPYQLELVYGEPIGDFQEVTVGTKWMIGDLINTNAYFRVPVKCAIDNPEGASAVSSYEYRTLQLYRKNLSAPDDTSSVVVCDSDTNSYKNCYGYSIPNITLGCMPSDAKTYFTMFDLEWTQSIFFVGNVERFKGLEVTGGNGTQEDPFTIAPIGDYQLENGTYKQTMKTQYGDHYTRFVFVKPKSEIEGKSKAVFTATNKNGVTKKFETSTYYTGMTTNSEYFTPADENSVMFIVTVKAHATEDDTEPLEGLTCTLDFE